MSPTSCFVVALLGLAPAASGQSTWYVDDDNCPNQGTGTPADPFCSIQDGIAAASNGDTVLVLPGTYSEVIDFLGKAIVVISRDGAATTTIQGNSNGSETVVTFANGEGRNSVLEGFTITGGGIWANVSGIYCTSSPTIRANVITGNSGYTGTGGILSSGGAWIVDNQIVKNGSTYGVGGLAVGGTTLVEDNWIEGNASGFGTGGADCGDHAVLRRNTILGNWTSDGLIGGLDAGGDARIEGNRILGNYFTVDALIGGVMCRDNCVFEANEISNNQGGIQCFGSVVFVDNLITGNYDLGAITSVGGSILLVNDTIYGNTSASYAGGVVCSGGTVTIVNTILWHDQGKNAPEITAAGTGAVVDVSWSDVEGGSGSTFTAFGGTVVWGSGMITADPQFVDPDGLDDDPATYDDNDFHLVAGSPCVDAADNTAAGLPAVDFEGDVRTFDVPGTADTGNGTAPLADMGCDEFAPHVYFEGDATPGGPISLTVTGIPGGSPVVVWIALGVLDPPVNTRFGPWYLAPPIFTVLVSSIPADGILATTGNLPTTPPAPYAIDAQAAILSGPYLTNLAVLQVR